MIALRKTGETATKITLGWDPVDGADGYRFQSSANAPKWSHTWDGSRTQVVFAKGQEPYRVEALEVSASGEWPQAVAAIAERPFDPDHPVYQPVPPGCPLYEHSDLIAATISGNPVVHINTWTDSPAVFEGQPGDPLWTLVSPAGDTFRVRAPDSILAGSGSDAPLVVLDPAYEGFCTSGSQPTEFRMWRAVIDRASRTVTCSGMGCGSYRSDGAQLANQTVKAGRVARALGQAEAYGNNTGSGCSYTVGMIRAADIQAGRIDHAIRIASWFVHGSRWFWPALRTEPARGTTDDRAPMGSRLFLDPSVDARAVGDAAAARVADARAKAFLRMLVLAMQEFGWCVLDGSDGNALYLDSGADWESLIGPKNSYGSYHDLGRALSATVPWHLLRVAHPDVFNSHGR